MTPRQPHTSISSPLKVSSFLAPLVVHHRFISFTLYCGCFIAFVLSLVRRHYLKQFTLVSLTPRDLSVGSANQAMALDERPSFSSSPFQFGWTHVSLLIIVSSTHFLIQNIFDGLIW